MGELFRETVEGFGSPLVREVRGRGLLNAVDVADDSPLSAMEICYRLANRGVLAKPTHDSIIRFVSHHQPAGCWHFLF